MSDFFRVKHPLFGEYSARRPNLDEVKVIDKPAVDRNGHALPAKPLTPAATTAAVKKNTPTPGAEPATTPEEGSA